MYYHSLWWSENYRSCWRNSREIACHLERFQWTWSVQIDGHVLLIDATFPRFEQQFLFGTGSGVFRSIANSASVAGFTTVARKTEGRWRAFGVMHAGIGRTVITNLTAAALKLKSYNRIKIIAEKASKKNTLTNIANTNRWAYIHVHCTCRFYCFYRLYLIILSHGLFVFVYGAAYIRTAATSYSTLSSNNLQDEKM